MNTNLKPTLQLYGSRANKRVITCKKLLAIIIALPLGTSPLVVFMPFVRGAVWVRL